MSAVTSIIDRLDRVRQTAPDRWVARCPAHDDRSPSLSIRELDDGRVLVHDFGGCGVTDVLASLGLELRDLYPARLDHHIRPSHSRIPARDLLEIVDHEVLVVLCVAAAMLERRAIDDDDWQRLSTAVGRIGRAREHARGR